MNALLSVLWQHLIPQHTLSRLMGFLANCKWPWFKNVCIEKFIAHYGVDMSLAQEPNARAYPSFNAFFTRALKPELRPIVAGENSLACPVDGRISQIGNIEQGRLLQAKGSSFSLQQLLGGEERLAALFEHGKFATIYLAPKDYHRIHMPFAGTLREMVYIPGRLFSVNTQSARLIPQLFARNERVVALFETAFGPMAVILVGALIVASIKTVWSGIVAPSRPKEIQFSRYVGSDIILQKGQELGHFQLGSTVILLCPQGIEWENDIVPEKSVVMGQFFGVAKT